ncbi:UNVERIFIED_CONTAM: hypothetical protein GTU68_059143 [Idotea baltica]|nr:hypothetical protein [Idotea baltica]
MSNILDGKALAKSIKDEMAATVANLMINGEKTPHLAAVLIGEDPASQVYVRNKVKSCEQVGFKSTLIRRAADISQGELLDIVEQLNKDVDVDGFIVQLPLPKHINEEAIPWQLIQKRRGWFHPSNFGRMAQGLPAYLPATPNGILEMLKRYEVPTEGKEVVVLGRSNIVGMPISILLAQKNYPGNASVTICHSRTKDLKAHTLRADIIIAAIGIPAFLTADMVKERGP